MDSGSTFDEKMISRKLCIYVITSILSEFNKCPIATAIIRIMNFLSAISFNYIQC